jgi:hypothetical protein
MYGQPPPYGAPSMYEPQQPYGPMPQPPMYGAPPSNNNVKILIGLLLVLVILAGGGYGIYYLVEKAKADKEAEANAAATKAADAKAKADKAKAQANADTVAKAQAATQSASQSAATPKPIDTNIPTGPNTMKSDPNYGTVIKAYTTTAGFGNNRNTAIVIVGNFMVANGLTGNPQTANDAQLYSILLAPDAATAYPLIAASIPSTSMRMDMQYNSVMKAYDPNNGGWPDGIRNTAIVIVGSFINANNIKGIAVQSYSNEQLYAILSATSINNAISMIKGT